MAPNLPLSNQNKHAAQVFDRPFFLTDYTGLIKVHKCTMNRRNCEANGQVEKPCMISFYTQKKPCSCTTKSTSSVHPFSWHCIQLEPEK
uniref:Uncharacterized protein n=1 Tax=Rhizophora mucronata TaxID=61149 RepID=A0A2P2KJ55_RHIMU